MDSAIINTTASKSKKKRDKKKAKKQAAVAAGLNPDSEISSPALTDKENFEPTAETTTSSDPLGDKASTEPATDSTTTQQPLIENKSLTASALPAIPIQEQTSVPAEGPVGVGAAGTTTSGLASSSGFSSLTKFTSSATAESLPLPDHVKYCIKATVNSGYIDLMGIVKNIQQKTAAGEYKSKVTSPTPTTPTKISVPQSDEPIKVQQATTAPLSKDTTKDHLSKLDTVKKVATGAGAAMVGAGAAVAGVVKGKTAAEPNTSTTPPKTTTTNVAARVSSEEPTKLSESVQYCIKSVVNAPAVDVYGILDPSSKEVKRPEPAVGGPAQPTMPSSTKAADHAAPSQPINKKGNKEQYHRKSPLTSLKKKNCIIL